METNDAIPGCTPELAPVGEVETMTSVKKTKIYQMCAAGDFPPPIKIGRASRWLISDVREWIEEQARVAHAKASEARLMKST
jgi:prophage regulatory protein